MIFYSYRKTLFIKSFLLAFGILVCSFSQNVFAQHKIDSLVNLLQKETNQEEKVDLLLDLSDEYFYINSTTALDYAFQASNIVSQTGFKNDTLKAETDYCIGSIYGWMEDTIKGFQYLDQSLKISEKIPLKILMASIHGDKGLAYGQIGVYDKAMLCYEKSRKISIEIKDTLGISATNNNIGIIYLELKAYDKARKYLEDNYKIAVQINDVHGQAITMSNLGDLASEEKNFDRSLQLYQNAIHIVDSMGMKYGVMHSYQKMADVYTKKGLTEIAVQHYFKAYELAKELEQAPEIAACAIKIAKGKQNQGKLDQSLKKAEEALSYIDHISSKETIADIYKCLANNYKATGDFKKSVTFYEKYEMQRDSLVDQGRTKIFAELDLRYQTEKKETENKYLKTEQLKNQLVIQQRTLIAIGVGIGLLILSFLTFSLHQQNLKKKNYNTLLEQEVERRTRHLNTSNQRLTKANQELESFAYIASHDLKEPLRNISGFSSLILRELKKQNFTKIKDYLDFIIKNTKQMNVLIEDILSFSKINKDGEIIKTSSFAEIMTKVKNDLKTKIEEKKAQIIYQSPTLSNIESDIQIPIQLYPVFKNLIENGLKYNKNQSPTITINYSANETNNTFSITDNGIGIAAEYHKTIFEMFKRLHNRNDYDGSGIGLAICKKTIENLGGVLSLKSELEEGTTFKFTIPTQSSLESHAASFNSETQS